MCLILLSYRQHARYPLVIAANRDEFYDRPSQPAHFWEGAPWILAGKDLAGGGTWLGITRSGRFAAVSNIRDPEPAQENARSRGLMVSEFLRGDPPPRAYVAEVARQGPRYNGFNLLAGDHDEIAYYNNRSGEILTLAPGLYGLSNHRLDTPWPKVEKAKSALAKILGMPTAEPEAILEMLADRTIPPDGCLPDTGVGLVRERVLASIFIASENYGTRCSSVLIQDRDRRVRFVERNFSPEYAAVETVAYEFDISVADTLSARTRPGP
ncbi:MAG: NRDE family protein [Chromatiales bacterium]